MNPMLFNAEIINHKFISNVFESISNILENGTLEITKKGISIIGMDISHVSLIDLKLDKTEFSNFRIEPEKLHLGIIFTDFVKILKTGNDSEKMIFDVETNDELNITFVGNGLDRKFTLKLIESIHYIPDWTFVLIVSRRQKKTHGTCDMSHLDPL